MELVVEHSLRQQKASLDGSADPQTAPGTVLTPLEKVRHSQMSSKVLRFLLVVNAPLEHVFALLRSPAYCALLLSRDEKVDACLRSRQGVVLHESVSGSRTLGPCNVISRNVISRRPPFDPHGHPKDSCGKVPADTPIGCEQTSSSHLLDETTILSVSTNHRPRNRCQTRAYKSQSPTAPGPSTKSAKPPY